MRGAKIDAKQRNPKIYSEISARLLRLKICHFWRAIFRLANSSVGAAIAVGAAFVAMDFGLFAFTDLSYCFACFFALLLENI